MEAPMEKPTITPHLIEYLEEVYPDRLPQSEFDRKYIDQKMGEQNVIRHLRSLMQMQSQPEE